MVQSGIPDNLPSGLENSMIDPTYINQSFHLNTSIKFGWNLMEGLVKKSQFWD